MDYDNSKFKPVEVERDYTSTVEKYAWAVFFLVIVLGTAALIAIY